jgi:Leucine-rich repeat (LRR) protein
MNKESNMDNKIKIFFHAILFGFLCITISCLADDTVTITKHYGDQSLAKERLPGNTEKIVIKTDTMYESIIKIEGIENIKNLKYLYIKHSLEDFSFLDKLESLEMLVIEDSVTIDLNFLSELKKLKTLYLNGVTIKQTTIDFSNNINLEFVFLGNLNYNSKNKFFELDFVNTPKTIKCIDLSLSIYIIITESLMNKIIHTPIILVMNEPVSVGNKFKINEDYLEEHPNIITKNIRRMQPKEIQQKYIRNFFNN